MVQKALDFLAARAKPPVLLFLLGLFLLFAIVFGLLNGPVFDKTGGRGTLDSGFYTPETAWVLLDAAGIEGRKAMLLPWAVDLFFPPVYSALFLLSLVFFLGRSGLKSPLWKFSLLLPLACIACDYGENILVLGMLLSFPSSAVKGLAAVGMIFTALKFLFFLLSLLGIAGFFLLPRILKFLPATPSGKKS